MKEPIVIEIETSNICRDAGVDAFLFLITTSFRESRLWGDHLSVEGLIVYCPARPRTYCVLECHTISVIDKIHGSWRDVGSKYRGIVPGKPPVVTNTIQA